MYRISLICFLLNISISFGQTGLEIFPDSKSFKSLIANMHEAKFGLTHSFVNGDLKVDIGNSTDLINYRFDSCNSLALGIEFYAYALATDYSEYRLQIDALDGFFGGYAVYSHKYDSSSADLRFRFTHNSAHLVDGHWDRKKKTWINNDIPIAFTKDNAELTFALNKKYSGFEMRSYVLSSYAVLVRPAELKKFNFAAGTEIKIPALFGKFIGTNAGLLLAYDLSVTGLPEYVGCNSLIAGIDLDNGRGKGVLFYFSYYKGRNYFSEYYYKGMENFGLGFRVNII